MGREREGGNRGLHYTTVLNNTLGQNIHSQTHTHFFSCTYTHIPHPGQNIIKCDIAPQLLGMIRTENLVMGAGRPSAEPWRCGPGLKVMVVVVVGEGVRDSPGLGSPSHQPSTCGTSRCSGAPAGSGCQIQLSLSPGSQKRRERDWRLM